MSEGARIIWIIFGDMSGGESVRDKLTAHYNGLRKDADKKGITLGFLSASATKKTFFKLIAEPAMVAFVWHSHGEYSPFATGNMLAAGGEPVMASEIKRIAVSKRLQFAALLGCGAFPSEAMRQEWLRALHLDRLSEPIRRLYAFGGTITADRMYDFSSRRTLNNLSPFRFLDWLDMISL